MQATPVDVAPPSTDMLLWRAHIISLASILILVPIYCTDPLYRAALICGEQLTLLLFLWNQDLKKLETYEIHTIAGNVSLWMWLLQGALPWLSYRPGILISMLFFAVQMGLLAYTFWKEEFRFTPYVNLALCFVLPLNLSFWQPDLQMWAVCIFYIILWQAEIHLWFIGKIPIQLNPMKSFILLMPVLRFGFYFSIPYSAGVAAYHVMRFNKGQAQPEEPVKVEPPPPPVHQAEVEQKQVKFDMKTRPPRSRTIDIFSRADQAYKEPPKSAPEEEEKPRLANKALRALWYDETEAEEP